MSFWRSFLSVFFFSFCPGCGQKQPKLDLCACCKHQLTPRPDPRCGRCDALFSGSKGGHWCRQCLSKSPHFDRVFGLFEYDGPIGAAIRRGKYNRYPEIFDWIAKTVVLALPGELYRDPPSAVVPVPIHWRRRVQRRFDPPRFIAESVAYQLGVQLDVHFLDRVRDTPTQAKLSDKERRRNVRRAFKLRGKPMNDILLVDDVFTTGATVNEISRVLKRAGCKRVRVVCASYVDPLWPVRAAKSTVAYTPEGSMKLKFNEPSPISHSTF